MFDAKTKLEEVKAIKFKRMSFTLLFEDGKESLYRYEHVH